MVTFTQNFRSVAKCLSITHIFSCRLIFIVSATIFCYFSVAFGNEKPKLARVLTEVKTDSNSIGQEEVATLKAQLATMREFNQSILNTVYWSLGTIVVLAVILIGFSWFTNYKMHEREILSLRQELMNAFEARVSTFSSEFNQNALTKFNEISGKSIEVAKSASQQTVEHLKDQINTCLKGISSLKYDSVKAEAQYWELKKVPGNHLNYCIEMLSMAIKNGVEVYIGSNLNTIQKLLSEGAPLYNLRIAPLTELLDALPAKFSTQSDALRTALKNAKTY